MFLLGGTGGVTDAPGYRSREKTYPGRLLR
jgi:hypothetical protein